MSCDYCEPDILENGMVRSKKLDFGDGTAQVSYREVDERPEFELSIGRDWDGSSIDLAPNSKFKYCPFCGGRYSDRLFKQAYNHEQLSVLLETMRILAVKKLNFETELAIYRMLGGAEQPWFDTLKEGKGKKAT